MGVLSFFAWLQNDLWKKDAEAAKPVARPRILFANSRLVFPANESDPLRIALSLTNHGNTDGTVTIKDQTYSFTTHSSQKSFKYATSPAQEIRVAAIPNAIYEGELRFDFRLTPEKLSALNSGKARLFFFARGEYRDESNKTYPLPFSAMYDPHISGNLIDKCSDICRSFPLSW
jgi:hypothetical protein